MKIRSFLYNHGVVTFDLLKLNKNRSDLSCRCFSFSEILFTRQDTGLEIAFSQVKYF